MLTTILGLVQLAIEHAPEEKALITGGLDVYRTVRDSGQGEPDALTDDQLAQLAKDKGVMLQVNADHWLAQYGFTA